MFKISTQGMSAMTGSFGGVYFEDGFTTEDLTLSQINRLGAIIILEKVAEDGSSFQVGPSCTDPLAIAYIEDLIAKRDIAYQELTAPVAVEKEDSLLPTTPSSVFVGKYTREYLEAIADKSGMSGLREIAPDTIKSKSVDGLIKALLTLTVPV